MRFNCQVNWFIVHNNDEIKLFAFKQTWSVKNIPDLLFEKLRQVSDINAQEPSY